MPILIFNIAVFHYYILKCIFSNCKLKKQTKVDREYDGNNARILLSRMQKSNDY